MRAHLWKQLIFNRNCSDIIRHCPSRQTLFLLFYRLQIWVWSKVENLHNPPKEVPGGWLLFQVTQVLYSFIVTLELPEMFPTLSFLVFVRKTLGPQMLLSSLQCLSSITCLPVKTLYYWLYSQIHLPFPATIIFTSRGALLTRVFLAGLDIAWLHSTDMHSSCWVAEIVPYHFCIPSWQGVWLCRVFFPLQKE